jgi:glycosyltransferase involved in cell wall biosynthesis
VPTSSDISAIIPTYRRPELVTRAVRSALNQTHRPAEVIVVVDGRDEPTVDVVQAIRDPMVRVLIPDRHLGHAAARNLGVSHAIGEWVALLDDDDEWLPRKLEVQLAAAQRSHLHTPIVACRLIARTGRADLIWPRRLPRPGEALCDYLCRRSLPLSGEGLVQMSMILTRRDLLQRVRFTEGLRRHVDPDWLLRAVGPEGAGASVIFPDALEPLAVWHIEQGRARVSIGGDWRYSLRWGRSRRDLFTSQAYAGFICKNVSALAAAAGDYGAFAELLREARRFGRPSWVDLASHLMNFVLTPAARDTIWGVVQTAGRQSPIRWRRGRSV